MLRRGTVRPRRTRQEGDVEIQGGHVLSTCTRHEQKVCSQQVLQDSPPREMDWSYFDHDSWPATFLAWLATKGEKETTVSDRAQPDKQDCGKLRGSPTYELLFCMRTGHLSSPSWCNCPGQSANCGEGGLAQLACARWAKWPLPASGCEITHSFDNDWSVWLGAMKTARWSKVC